ncbi:MAG: hypothetical protein JXA61_09415 [Bacteroidales bacterium]|nr:hypothetical protein [Bacteroidales bacterium]
MAQRIGEPVPIATRIGEPVPIAKRIGIVRSQRKVVRLKDFSPLRF